MKSIPIAVISALVLLPCAGKAQSLEQKQKYRAEQEQIDKSAEWVSEKCGIKITAEFDWKSGKFEDFSTYSPSAYCENALSAISTTCEDKDGKDAVKQTIRKVLCRFGGKEESKRSTKLNGSTLELTIAWDATNYHEYILGFLGKNL